MEWLTCTRKAIDYMEEHLEDNISAKDVAGIYKGGDVPEGMTVYELPDFDWAIFDCYGPCPKALQDVNTKIWKEWLPGNPDFEFPGRVNIEWYGDGDPSASDYHAAIWIPVKKK